MDLKLARIPVDLASTRTGAVQRAGPLTMVPLLGDGLQGQFVPPLTGLKLSRVAGYGKVEMECLRSSAEGIAIVPLHIGYIQDGAQNHALCRSGLLASGQKRMFEDACCVQQTQGGYLEGREQWFFILPLSLRDEALGLRGTVSYGKLWPAISALNLAFGKAARGHLDEIVCRERPWLTQYNGRLERLPGQRGALFLLGDKLVGIELAPNPEYFAEVWPALVCFCYGVEAMRWEQANPSPPAEPYRDPYEASDLPSLRAEVAHRRSLVEAQVADQLASTPQQRLEVREEERLLDLTLSTLSNERFSGQLVQQGSSTVYASIAAKPGYLAA